MPRDARVEETLARIVPAFEAAFPGRIRGAYVHGSHADDSAVSTSDLDLIILFKDAFAADEKPRADALAAEWVAQSSVELDLEVIDEATLFARPDPAFKLGSRLVAGEDVRDSVSLTPIADWTRDRMHTSYWKLVKLFDRPAHVSHPIGYPAPDGRLKGYCSRTMRLADDRDVPCTRDLIRLVSWIGTSLVALRAGEYVVRKSDCHPTYQRTIGDEWGSLLEAIYVNCKTRWEYFVPADEGGLSLLTGLCERTLAFENHFLLAYKEFVLSELRSGDATAIGTITWLQSQIPFEDSEIVSALGKITG